MKNVLGRGLEALIPEMVSTGEREIVEIEIERITPGKYQPRIDFDEERQKELIASIREKGVVQPVIVRRSDGLFELIAGERRLRAARELGMRTVPAIVKDVDDEQALELSIVENVQREDLNPIEEARAYERLASEFCLTQEQIGEKVGKSRAAVANAMRLLKLPQEIQKDILEGRLSAGHAKVILMLAGERHQKGLRDAIVARGMSVREAERMVERMKAPRASRRRAGIRLTAELAKLEEEMRRAFGTQVRIIPGKRKGKIEIEYYSHEDLERIMELVGAPME